MSLPRVLAVGHSHLGALVAAVREAPPKHFDLAFYQFIREDRPHIVHAGGTWTYNPESERELRSALEEVRPSLVVFALQGEQAITVGLTAPEEPFEFCFPHEADETPLPGERIVPFDMLWDVATRQYQLIADSLDRLLPHVPCPTVSLSAPPPVADAEFIVSLRLQHANLAEKIERFGLASKRSRMRIWRLHMMALRSIYERRGVTFIAPPDDALDADGALKDQFRTDAFHANQAYGHLVMQQIDAALCGLIAPRG